MLPSRGLVSFSKHTRTKYFPSRLWVVRHLALHQSFAPSLPPPARARRVEVIAHRGASGYYPDHTMLAYERAFAVGSDWVELDCHMTKDGHLVTSHDVELSTTTNCADVFPGRRRRVHAPGIDGDPVDIEGWIIPDFTLDEIQRLRVRMRHAKRAQERDNLNGMAVFRQVCDRLQVLGKERAASTNLGGKLAPCLTGDGENSGGALAWGASDKGASDTALAFSPKPACGLYVETKRPGWYRSLGLPLEEQLVEDVAASGFQGRVTIQSFEPESLQRIAALRPDWRRVRLLTEDQVRDMLDHPVAMDAFMSQISQYAHGVGPSKSSIVPDPARPPQRSPLVDAAHDHGLVVHPYTFRSDVLDLHQAYCGNSALEFWRFFLLGVDGCFTDFPSHAVFAREMYEAMVNAHPGIPPYLRSYLEGGHVECAKVRSFSSGRFP